MAVFLSPGVFTTEIDLSVLPAGAGALRPAFIGAAKKGPMNAPTLITSPAQYVEVFGEPFPESYLGYAVLAFLEEGNSCYVLRVGVEYEDGMDEALADVAIDTSGSKAQGWGRIPVFSGIDRGIIKFRAMNTPIIISAASASGSSLVDANEAGSAAIAGSVTTPLTAYNGCYRDVYTVTITGGPTGTGPIAGATFSVTDSSGTQVQTGTLTAASETASNAVALKRQEGISFVDSGVTFVVNVTNGVDLAAGDFATITVVPDSRSCVVTVGGTPQTLAVPAASYSTVNSLVEAINNLNPIAFEAISAVDTAGDTVVALRTVTSGDWIQINGSCAFCAEVGLDQYTYDIPRAHLIGVNTAPFTISSANNQVVLDVIGSETVRFAFNLPVGTNMSAAAIAAAIDANGTDSGTDYFEAMVLTTPGGVEHVVIMAAAANQYAQLQLQATYSHLTTLRFADKLGINYPYSSSYRSYVDPDGRVVLPTMSGTSAGAPASCDLDPSSNACTVDSAYYQNIVGWFIAKTPGTWISNYTLSLEGYTEGVGDTAGRYKVTVRDLNGNAMDTVQDVSFDQTADRYIGNLVNAGAPLATVSGNAFYSWEPVSSAVTTSYRAPSQFVNRAFSAGADGVATGIYSDELDKVVIGNPALATGIHAFQNPESFDFNLLIIPGFSSGAVIAAATQFCENRGDVLFLVDPPARMRPQQVIDWHNGMMSSDLTTSLNTSYGALYWSWVKVTDQFNGGTIWIPPSGPVAAVYARTERVAEQWAAPAGTNRGRLLSVLELEYNPTQGERDALYGSGNAVNPIVNFAQEGVTVWGQRTLQRRDSALDRVNVRMLMIFLKKNLQSALRGFTFEFNDRATRSHVTSIVNSFLSDIAARRGLEAFVVVCDGTNNTSERIDRHELWVSVFVKPAMVAEFIALNLVVMRTGANFAAQEVLAAGGVVTG